MPCTFTPYSVQRTLMSIDQPVVHVCCAAPLEFWVTVGGVIVVVVIILTGLSCGLFFFLKCLFRKLCCKPAAELEEDNRFRGVYMM